MSVKLFSLRCALAIFSLFLATAGGARGAPLSTLAAFDSMATSELDSLQVKFTAVGPHIKSMHTVVLLPPGKSYDSSVFAHFRVPGTEGDYGSDFDDQVLSANIGLSRLASLIDTLSAVPVLLSGTQDEQAELSIALSNTHAGTTRVFEKRLSRTNGSQVAPHLLRALSGEALPVELVADLACNLQIHPPPSASDVTALTAVRLRGPRSVKNTDEFTLRLRVTNTSGSTLPSPLIVVVSGEGEADLLAPTGYTCGITPSGSKYFELPVGAGLAPGNRVELDVRLRWPDRQRIHFGRIRVVSGEGPY